MNLFAKTFKITFLLILIAELFSLCGYILPTINIIGFLVIVLLVLIASIYKLEYGLLAVLAELFVGSFGYLYSLNLFGKVISLRLALWLVVMLVWLALTIKRSWQQRRLTTAFCQSANFYLFLFFFIIIAGGFINGFIHHHIPANLFFDFKRWVYLALIFPIYDVVLTDRKRINDIMQVFTAAALWLALETLFLAFIFSHNIDSLTFVIYRWIRTTGVGEITLIQGGFFRIFFQSHIYLLTAFFLFLFALVKKSWQDMPANKLSKKQLALIYYLIFTIIFSVNIINFSRSNWLGLAMSLAMVGLFFIYVKNWTAVWRLIIITFSSFILSIAVIVSIVKFPYPAPLGGFDTEQLLSQRVSAVTDEAAVSSRWSLLPKLWQAIETSPWLGEGYGATVTYNSSDPRLLEKNSSGLYTTYAFEWGWLDVWLKLGAIGLCYYLFLLFKIYIKDNFKTLVIQHNPEALNNPDSLIASALIAGMVAIVVVNISSPYLNHPLGLGYLVISAAILEKMRSSAKTASN